jgi:hypothetical protein
MSAFASSSGHTNARAFSSFVPQADICSAAMTGVLTANSITSSARPSRFGGRSSRRKRCGPTRKVRTTTSVTLKRLLTRCSGSQDVPYVSSITLPCSKRCMCDMDTPFCPGAAAAHPGKTTRRAVSQHIAGKLGCRTKTTYSKNPSKNTEVDRSER